MGRIKVLHMPLANTKGGVEQYVLQNWQFIDRTKYQFDIVTRSKVHDCLRSINKDGGEILTFTNSSDEDEEQFQKEMMQILERGYDAVHLHTSHWKGFLVEELARKAGCNNIIVHAHSTWIDVIDEEKRNGLLRIHEMYKKKFNNNLADRFLACSQRAAEWIFGEQIPREQIVLMKNAVDLKKFRYDEKIREKKRAAEKFGERFVIGHVARFSYQKNHEFLLELMADVKNQMSEICLILIGSGPLMGDIKLKVKEYGVEEIVRFYGERDDIAELLQAMDIFLLPSRFEGFPITLVEAQAAGLPCIVSDTVTDEADVTGNVTYLPCEIKRWTRALIKLQSCYRREPADALIREAGYDIAEQIKIVERLYERA